MSCLTENVLIEKNSAEDTAEEVEDTETQPLEAGDLSKKVEVSTTEAQLGILEYLNPNNSGFPGAVIKQRFSDFNVTEIDKAGKLVRLDNSDPPDETPEETRTEEAFNYTSLTESQKIIFTELMFQKAKLLNNQDKIEANDNLDIDVTDKDKEQRREVHTVLKRFGKLDSNTVEKEGRKLIVVKRKNEFKGGHRNWPRDRPRFLHFTLYKENCETFEAIGGLAQKTRVDPKHFSYAGTKDRRGRTLQRISVSMTTAKKILGATAANWKLEVGNFSYEKFDVKLGDLSGNRFTLGIRNVKAASSELKPVMEYFQKHGFINYFGTQRFGTSAGVPTSNIGKALLQGDFSEAVNLILRPREYERLHSLREAREVWSKTKDAHKALAVLKKGGKDRVLEGRLLYGLTRAHQNDVVGALEEIPPHQRSMYCHAFQSLLWNKVVSRRIRTHGQAVREGDLVYKKNVPEPGEGSEVSKEDLVEYVVNPDQYSFTDILIPIPGCRVKWPNNEIKDWFNEELTKEGMDWDCFESSIKVYNMPGDYRHPCVLPKNVTWEMVTYTDTQADILPSLKEINRKEHRMEDQNGDTTHHTEIKQNSNGETDHDKEENNGDTVNLKEVNNGDAVNAKQESNGDAEKEKKLEPYSALILSLTLPSSTYATMALREILRVETDRASLTKQNDYKRPQPVEVSGEEPPTKVLKTS